MSAAARMAEIRSRIEAALTPETLEVEDQGHMHIGHEGAKDGRGHFRVLVVSGRFEGQPMIKRHRMIYDAVGDLMQTDIHALAIEAFAPDEI